MFLLTNVKLTNFSIIKMYKVQAVIYFMFYLFYYKIKILYSMILDFEPFMNV
jgi:hypothetical protein